LHTNPDHCFGVTFTALAVNITRITDSPVTASSFFNAESMPGIVLNAASALLSDGVDIGNACQDPQTSCAGPPTMSAGIARTAAFPKCLLYDLIARNTGTEPIHVLDRSAMVLCRAYINPCFTG